RGGVTIGGTSAGTGNLVSGNAESGIYLDEDSPPPVALGDVIEGNLIGTDVTGSTAVPNGTSNQTNLKAGILVYVGEGITIGGTVAAARNVVSGNPVGIWLGEEAPDGVGLTGDPIEGNYIGTTAGGTAALPNGIGIQVGGDARNETIGGP